MGLIYATSFQTLAARHKGDYQVKDFICCKQLLCTAFASSPIGKA